MVQLLLLMDDLAFQSMPWFDFSGAFAARPSCSPPFTAPYQHWMVLKRFRLSAKRWSDALAQMRSADMSKWGNLGYPQRLSVNRIKAQAHKAKPQKHPDGEPSIFCQLMAGLQVSPAPNPPPPPGRGTGSRTPHAPSKHAGPMRSRAQSRAEQQQRAHHFRSGLPDRGLRLKRWPEP